MNLLAWLLVATSSVTSTATPTPDLDPVLDVTRETRDEGQASASLAFYLLDLPQAAAEAALAPVLIPALIAFEKWHIHQRIFELLTNEERTLAFVPVIDPTNRSGLSLGLAVLANDPLGSPDRTIVIGMVRANGDRVASFSYARRIPSLSGRLFRLSANYSRDHDARYFGIGGNSSRDNERALGLESFDASASLELPGTIEWNARVELALRRRELRMGQGNVPSVAADDIVVAPPPGFERTLYYPEGTFTLSYDSRDANGRPMKGIVADLSATFTHDLQGASTGGVTGIAQLGAFLPVLPLHRVLVLTGGVGYAIPLGEEIPFYNQISLGGGNRLRGYTNDRFVDRLGWWATAEYRHKIYEWAASGNGLSSTLFFDAGQVGRVPEDFARTPLRWSVGFGFRFEMNLFFLGRIQIAASPEGPRLVVSVSEIL